MPSKILIISKGAAFMTNALVTNLKKAGYLATVIEPNVKDIAKESESADLFLIYGGAFVSECTDVFIYLKDICTENNKTICLVGYPDEITEIKKSISPTLIGDTIERPFDMKVLLNKLDIMLIATEERKKGKHILLVDDDVMFLKMMQDWLSMKYNVTISRSGMQAITYITNHKPDLILLDYDMPIVSGTQVMEMIRSEPNSANIPIIFLTGNSDRQSVMKVMALKPQGYLLKSMNKDAIMENIDNFFSTQKWKNAQV